MSNARRKRMLWLMLAVVSLSAGILFSQKDRVFGDKALRLTEVNVVEAAFDAKRERVLGAPSSIRALRGERFTVVNLWATWCTPCRQEMPEFIALQKELGTSGGLQFIGVAIDRIEPVRRFMDEIGVNYPILFGDIAMLELTKHHGNDKQALPFSYVLDKDGRIVHTKLGKLTRSEILAISAKVH